MPSRPGSTCLRLPSATKRIPNPQIIEPAVRAGPAAPTHREHGVGEFSNTSPGPLARGNLGGNCSCPGTQGSARCICPVPPRPVLSPLRSPLTFLPQVGFPLREGLPVAGQHRQLRVGEAQRHNADQRERPGPAHLGRGGLRFPTAGKEAGGAGGAAPTPTPYSRAWWGPRCQLSMGPPMAQLLPGGEQGAPATNLSPCHSRGVPDAWDTPWLVGHI